MYVEIIEYALNENSRVQNGGQEMRMSVLKEAKEFRMK